MLKIFTKKTGQKGFTLVELLVVIAVIGILAGIVLVALGDARLRARNAQRMADIRAIQMAMEMFYDANDWVYATGADLEAVATDLAPYLNPIPTDPLGATPYVWIDNTADNQQFCVWAILEPRGEPGEGGAITVGEGGVFAASEKGTRELTAAPADLDCW